MWIKILSYLIPKNPRSNRTPENIRLRKNKREQRRRFGKNVASYISILLGILSAGFGLKGFIIPNQLIDGGAMGISLLTRIVTHFPLSMLIIVINLPFLALGWKQIGSVFALKSLGAILILAIAVAAIPYPHVTSDRILVSVFGGFFLGAGIGLAIRGGAVIDGTEVLAIYLSRRTPLTVGDFILIFNIIIFGAAAYLLKLEVALYSILTYLAASKTVDFILEGIEEYTGVTIISGRSRQICEMLQTKLGHGLTLYTGRKGHGRSGMSEQQIDIIFTVITRLESSRLRAEVEIIDPRAFIVMQSIKDTKGGMVKKIPLKDH
jgi:uncharacterized membrane-anchored protein YitT (DUF2179 family)